MNRKQKIVLWIGIIIFLWIGFNPHIITSTPMLRLENGMPIESPQTKYELAFGHKFTDLFCYWSMTAVVTCALIYTLKTKS